MNDKNIKELVTEYDICNPQYAATITEMLLQDTDTLASDRLESMDRVIRISWWRKLWHKFYDWFYYLIHPSYKYGIDRDEA